MHHRYRDVGHRQNYLCQCDLSPIQALSSRPHVFTVNLDPAVRAIPYVPLVDIRKTHEYKLVNL